MEIALSPAMVSFMASVDWQRPWLASILGHAQAIVAAPDWRVALNEAAIRSALRNHRGLPLRFVAQSDLPTGLAYEEFISTTGNVPTRDNLHDVFNALVWLSFPKIKRQLNLLQATEIARDAKGQGGAGTRGKQRDGATIFDENAALLIASDPGLISMLQNHDWQAAFLQKRALFGSAWEVCLFGHALMEKLVKPYKAITGHAWVVHVPTSYFAKTADQKREWLDDAISCQIAFGFGTANLTPLPILGVPGWWPGQDSEFYRDAAVFRPKRASTA